MQRAFSLLLVALFLSCAAGSPQQEASRSLDGLDFAPAAPQEVNLSPQGEPVREDSVAASLPMLVEAPQPSDVSVTAKAPRSSVDGRRHYNRASPALRSV